MPAQEQGNGVPRPPGPAVKPSEVAPSDRVLGGYFDSPSPWNDRLRARKDQAPTWSRSNLEVAERLVCAEQPGLRAVVNIGAHALIAFLNEGRYRNAYDRPRLAGRERKPSPKRQEIDALVLGDRAPRTYFAAVAMGGTGCRFYGEFCLVLRPERVRRARLLDRNSYELGSAPLSAFSDKAALVNVLSGQWPQDLTAMATLKTAETLPTGPRLTTAAQLSEAVLRDEDFMEVHVEGSFAPRDIEEVRKAPEDLALMADIAEGQRGGRPPTLSEMLWLQRRRKVEVRLRQHGIKARIVVTNGRGARWR